MGLDIDFILFEEQKTPLLREGCPVVGGNLCVPPANGRGVTSKEVGIQHPTPRSPGVSSASGDLGSRMGLGLLLILFYLGHKKLPS